MIMVLLLPQGVFAETGDEAVQAVTLSQNAQQNISLLVDRAKARIHRKMRMYHYYNVQVFGDNAWFFAFHKTNHNIPFGWYRLDLTKKFSKAQRVLASSEFSLLFRSALSPSGKEIVVTSKTGEVFVQNLINGKKQSLGAYITDQDYPQYSYPSYTPDGRYLILHDPWENSLLVMNTASIDISAGTVIPGFWLTERGGETPEAGIDLSVYQFSDDGTQVTFGNHTLNLLTLTKE